MARQQTAQANQTFGTATNNSANYGGDASTINSALTPFLMQRLTNPQGYSQGDMGAMLANAMGGAGGATSGITGQANLQAGRSRNDAGFGTALDAAARARTAAAAGSAEGVAASNANLKQDQTNNAAKMLQGLYGTDVGAQGSELNTANDATDAATKSGQSGWLQNMNAIWANANKSGDVVASFMCPIEGSLYLLPDGIEVPVETLRVGDLIAGIDDEAQTIEEIETGTAPCVAVTTENGYTAKNSNVHAYALPKGGFVVATKALGKTIVTTEGPSKVVSVDSIGEHLVFNIITDGSHTYRADGIWALGVGDAERHVSMDTWKRIGEGLGA